MYPLTAVKALALLLGLGVAFTLETLRSTPGMSADSTKRSSVSRMSTAGIQPRSWLAARCRCVVLKKRLISLLN
jgi:hypothetical protein